MIIRYLGGCKICLGQLCSFLIGNMVFRIALLVLAWEVLVRMHYLWQWYIKHYWVGRMAMVLHAYHKPCVVPEWTKINNQKDSRHMRYMWNHNLMMNNAQKPCLKYSSTIEDPQRQLVAWDHHKKALYIWKTRYGSFAGRIDQNFRQRVFRIGIRKYINVKRF